jgi:hypothetical protein
MDSKFRFFGRDIYRGRFFFRADRSLGAKQEGLTIVHFLNKLIVSCKEAVPSKSATDTNRKWILSFIIEWTIGVKYRK